MKNCVAKATKSSSVDNVFFPGHMRCLANGNFDPLQCVDRTASEDMCTCLDPATLKVNGSLTFLSLSSQLPCFDKDVHPPTYYQPCEARVQEIRMSKREFSQGGSRQVPGGSVLPNCSPDGYFAKVQHDPEDFR